MVKEIKSDYMSLLPNEDILTKEEIETWRSFVNNLSSKEEDKELFKTMLNDCYKYMLLKLTLRVNNFYPNYCFYLSCLLVYIFFPATQSSSQPSPPPTPSVVFPIDISDAFAALFNS
jgi:hypothetical protein